MYLFFYNIQMVFQISPSSGGGLEYFHRSPASYRRRRKGNTVCIGLGLGARLTTLFCKQNYCCEIQRSENRISLAESSKGAHTRSIMLRNIACCAT
jgi:hypothetical protein